jgi:hypothetical protein
MCPRCGFCRSLQVEGVAVLAATRKQRLWKHVFPGLQQALRGAPAALVALAVAFVAIVPLAILADHRFPPGSRERALWSAGNLLCGALLVLAGQAWAVTILKGIKERVHWGDLLSPFHLWGLTLRRLPVTAWPVGLGGSGVLAILSAVIWVGGLSYWFSLAPGADEKGSSPREIASRKADSGARSELSRVARALGFYQQKEDARSESSAERVPNSPVLSGVAPRASSPGAQAPRVPLNTVVDSRPTARCVIVGFVPAAEGRDPGLVLATLRDGELAFAGVVRHGLSKQADLLDRLSKLGRARPLIEGLNLNAVWVRPEMLCEVHQSGAGPNGELVDPSLKGLIED